METARDGRRRTSDFAFERKSRRSGTGPRTPEGLERSRQSGWKHGYSAEAKHVRREARQQLQLLRQLIAAENEDVVLDLISSMCGAAHEKNRKG